MEHVRLPFIDDLSSEFVKMLSVGVLECGVILVGMILCGKVNYNTYGHTKIKKP